MSAPLPSVTAASLIPELSLILCIQAVVAFDVMRWGHLLMVPDTIKDVLYPLALTVYSPAGVSSITLHNRMLQLIISILHSPAGVRTLHNRMLHPIISIAASASSKAAAADVPQSSWFMATLPSTNSLHHLWYTFTMNI